MKPKPYLLCETNWKRVKKTNYKIAVLPWGATEAHNYHLPFGTDNIQSEYIAEKAAGKAWKKGAKVIVLPNVPFGVNTQQLDIKLTINLNPSTQMMILRDVIDNLYEHNILKFVILNGHGGNDFKQMIRELKAEYPAMYISQVNWYMTVPDMKKYFDEPGDHAGEMETSNMLKIVPDLVLPLKNAGDGKNKKLKFKGRSEGWLWAPREWTRVTKDTGIGNPVAATAKKGGVYLKEVVEKIADYLVELYKTDLKDIYS